MEDDWVDVQYMLQLKQLLTKQTVFPNLHTEFALLIFVRGFKNYLQAKVDFGPARHFLAFRIRVHAKNATYPRYL